MADGLIGRRVTMQAGHPWAGHNGQIVRWEKTVLGDRPVVRLDNGQECFAMRPEHIAPMLEKGGKRRG